MVVHLYRWSLLVYTSHTVHHLAQLNVAISAKALYSFGQCISAPTFGYWSNRIEQVRAPLLTGFALMMIGNTLYLSLQFFSASSVVATMTMARIIVGCGTGNMALLRAYASTSSSKPDRSRAIACVGGGIATGILIGPAFQLLFTPLGSEGIYVLPFYRLNIYNAPALLSLLLNIVGFLVILFVFEERYDVLDSAAAKRVAELPSPCKIAVFVCIATRFSQITATSTFGTLGSAFSMLMFSLSKEEAVTINASAHLAGGCIGVVLYFMFIFFDVSKWLPPRLSSVLALSAYVALFALTLPWPFLPNKVEISSNGSDWGCFADRFSWCDDLTAVSPWIYYSSTILVFGIAGSILNITTTTLYSEIIGPRRQGTLQGIFQMAGSSGSMVGPLLSSALYSKLGPRVAWTTEIAQISIIVALWIIFRKKLTGLEAKDEAKKKSSTKEDA